MLRTVPDGYHLSHVSLNPRTYFKNEKLLTDFNIKYVRAIFSSTATIGRFVHNMSMTIISIAMVSFSIPRVCMQASGSLQA